MTEFPKLTSPLRLGNTTIKNRMFCTGHNVHFSMHTKGILSDKEIAFHTRKAEGEIALSTLGGTVTHPSAGTMPMAPLVNFDDNKTIEYILDDGPVFDLIKKEKMIGKQRKEH